MNEHAELRPLRGLLSYLTGSPKTIALLVFVGVLHNALLLAIAALSGKLIGEVLTGTPISDLVPVIGWLVATGAASAVTRWWQADVSHDWTFRLLAALRVRIYDGLARVTPGRVLGRRTGELVSIVRDDVTKTELFFAHTVGDYLGAVLVSVAALVLIGLVSPLAALAVVILMVLVASVPYVLASRAGEQGRTMRAELGKLNAEAVDGIQGLRELVIFRQGSAFLRRIARRTNEFHQIQRRYAQRCGVELSATEATIALGTIAVVLIGAQQVRSGTLAAADLPFLLLVAIAAVVPLATVSATARSLGDVSAAAARVLTIINQRAPVEDTGTRELAQEPAPTVEFRDVHFGYDTGRADVLRGTGFSVRAGETAAIVGRSGAGKTTCGNLLLRFWDPHSGQILIDGHNIRDLTLWSLRDRIALVPQDVYLFNMSVADNIRLARPDATDDEVELAAELAMTRDFVDELPEGYQTMCGERGASLSGGQRQRIAIARALLKDSPILVMDEAVSNLDAESEQGLREAIEHVTAERTVLMIAHRLSTIQSADRVIVLDDGVVSATGTHSELIAQSARYREILAAQQNEGVLVD